MRYLLLLITLSFPTLALSQDGDAFKTKTVLEKYEIDSVEGYIYKSYAIGVIQTLQSTSVFNERLGIKRLFCPPDNVPLNSDLLIQVISVEMLNAKQRGDYEMVSNSPFDMVALGTLHNFFPCD